jgi:hypothetical protein
MNNLPAVANHQNTTIISGNGPAAPVPHSALARIFASTTPSRIGCAFHVMSNDQLERRGIVLDETTNTFIVQFVDVWGLPHGEMKIVSKKRTENWLWFISVEHSNCAYDKLFRVQ